MHENREWLRGFRIDSSWARANGKRPFAVDAPKGGLDLRAAQYVIGWIACGHAALLRMWGSMSADTRSLPNSR